MIPLSIATAAYLAQLSLLLWVAYSDAQFHRYTAAKAVTSAGFLLVALLARLIGPRTMGPRFWLLFSAMVLCAAGDVLLGLANNGKGVHSKTFLKGLVCFGLAHVVFCAFYAAKTPPGWYDLLLPLALLGITMALSKRGLLRLKKLKRPAFCYCFLVGLMCSMAVSSVVVAGFRGPANLFAAAGSILFLLSDCIIIFLYFYIRQNRWMRFANLTAYYLGLLLLALSAAF